MIRISTRTHGIMDLVYSATFLAAPFILKALDGKASGKPARGRGRKRSTSQDTGVEKALLPAVGGTILAQGLTTDHEIGLVKAIPMQTHLLMDLGLSAFMMAAPWMLKMDKRVQIPMVVLGAGALALTLLTQTQPGYKLKNEIEDVVDNFVEEIQDTVNA